MSGNFNPAAAKAAKAEGMDRVERGANAEWVAQMQMHTVATAREKEFFTADDVFKRAIVHGMNAVTRDPRAFGPVMMWAAKLGVCRKANRLPINSARRSKHNSPMQVWQSLTYQGAPPITARRGRTINDPRQPDMLAG